MILLMRARICISSSYEPGEKYKCLNIEDDMYSKRRDLKKKKVQIRKKFKSIFKYQNIKFYRSLIGRGWK